MKSIRVNVASGAGVAMVAIVEIVREALRDAIKDADRYGVTRQQIADALGVHWRTLDSWKDACESGLIPTAHLAALLRRAVLPQDSKVLLVNELLKGTGLMCVIDDADSEDTGTPLQQLADIAESLGVLAAAVNKAARRDSDGGERITRTEARTLLVRLAEVKKQCCELERLLKQHAE